MRQHRGKGGPTSRITKRAASMRQLPIHLSANGAFRSITTNMARPSDAGRREGTPGGSPPISGCTQIDLFFFG